MTGEQVQAERRQVTVMFCDLAGSTELSERLDPEDLREVVRSYQDVASAAIAANGGYVAQYLGDGILAYFGYPTAHEDDARRAVRTGLTLVDDIADLSARSEREDGPAIAIRVGIDTGLVVVGEMGGGERHEQLAVGDTPNVAARLQTLAQPGQVVIGERTHRLVDGYFDMDALGAHPLKGISADMPVFAVTAERGFAPFSRLDMTPLVGRQSELATLRTAFREASAGRGGAISIVADPGIGKTRLILAVKEMLRGSPHSVLECRCSAYAQNTELLPITELLQRQFGIVREDTPEERWDKIRTTLVRSSTLARDAAPLFAFLLTVPLPSGAAMPDLPPRERRQAVLETITAWLLEVSERAPQVLVVEDLQWADPTTIELLGMIVERIGSASVLGLFAFRPELTPLWDGTPNVQRIDLVRLTASDTESLAEATAGGTKLPTSVLREIVTKTDGVPLFVEELTKALLESGQLIQNDGTYQLANEKLALSIPPTLQSSLMARLDRLGRDAKELAQLASVLGHTFTLDLLSTVGDIDRDALERRLAALADAELLYRGETDGAVTYTFKHALVQETAYESMLRSTRQRHHLKVARMLEGRFPDVVATQPELLARHYREGRDFAAAIRYLGQAGTIALQGSAIREAIAHFREGISLLPKVGAEGTAVEVSFQVGLGGALIIGEGYVTPDVERALKRALEIGSQIGDGPELLPALHGLWLYALVGGRFDEAGNLSERMLALTERIDDANIRAEAEYSRGLTMLFIGQPTSARALLESAIARLDPSAPRILIAEHKADATFRIFLAGALWVLGFPDAAASVAATAVELAEQYDHPFTLGTVLAWDGVVLQLLGQDAAAAEAGRRGVAISEANGLPFWQLCSALVVASSAEPADRIRALPPVIEAYNGIGARVMETHFRLRLATAHRDLGDDVRALQVLDEASQVARDTGQTWLESESLRLRGEILAVTDARAGEEWLRRAMDLARAQGSRMFELRVAVSLGRLLAGRGEVRNAQNMLRGVLDAFTEGFETHDLRQAQAFLLELDGSTNL